MERKSPAIIISPSGISTSLLAPSSLLLLLLLLLRVSTHLLSPSTSALLLLGLSPSTISTSLAPPSLLRLLLRLPPPVSVSAYLRLLLSSSTAISPSAIIIAPSATTITPFSHISSITKPFTGSETKGTQIIPRSAFTLLSIDSGPVYGSSSEYGGFLLGGKSDDAGVLGIDCQVDVKVLLPLGIKVDLHLHNIGSWLKIVLLLSGSSIGLESLQFLNVVTI
jgi:hypothetical protein